MLGITQTIHSNYCKHGYTFIHTFENNHIKSVECDRKRNTHTRWNQHICFDTICLTLCLSPSMVSFNYTMQILMDAYTHMHHSIIHSEGGQAWSGSEAEMSLLQLKNHTDTTKAKSVFKLASTASACPQRRINRLRSRQSADWEYFQTSRRFSCFDFLLTKACFQWDYDNRKVSGEQQKKSPQAHTNTQQETPSSHNFHSMEDVTV